MGGLPVSAAPSTQTGAPPSTEPTRQFNLTVVVRIKPAEVGALRAELLAAGEETRALMRGGAVPSPTLPFANVTGTRIHYARLVILENEPGGARLAFGSDFDGPDGRDEFPEAVARSMHAAELATTLGAPLDKIFARCEGYGGPNTLAQFLTDNHYPAGTSFNGAPGRSCRQIVWEADLRRHVDAALEDILQNRRETDPAKIRALVISNLTADGTAPIPRFPPQPNLNGVVNAKIRQAIGLAIVIVAAVVFGGQRAGWSWPTLMALVATLAVVALLAKELAILLLRAKENRDPQFQPKDDDGTWGRVALARSTENEFEQNQLTHIVDVKPGIFRMLLLRGVFYVLQILATNRYNKGDLGGIPSIHLARWMILPGRRLLFFSNFDSSWQSYLGDFIDQASSGLTAVWSNTVGYPRTEKLLYAGSRDAGRFLAWTRHHQVASEVWYSAYPYLSIKNVNDNTFVRRGLADPTAVEATEWLSRLRSVDKTKVDEQFGEEHAREVSLNLDAIQGIVLRGYGHKPAARFLLGTIKQSISDAQLADLRRWLAGLPVTSAAEAPKTRRGEKRDPFINVAFNHRGLTALKLDASLLAAFPVAFRDDSHDHYRRRVNGDADGEWEWGSRNTPVHLVLLVYADTDGDVEKEAAELASKSKEWLTFRTLEGTTLAGRKEHFGFRDGISQPIVAGSGRPEEPGNTVAAGEFLLGHRDGYGNVYHGPLSSQGFNFGYNGSFLVFRQLEQHVEAFWKFCAQHAGNDTRAVEFASKMVGRWPSGASLVRHPDSDPARTRDMLEDDPERTRTRDENDFQYLENSAHNDRYGSRCPLGAHIRRSNPRDWHTGGTREDSLRLSNLHRLIRRGRPYGPQLESIPDAAKHSDRSHVRAGPRQAAIVQESVEKPEPTARGLQFLCFNANLERQFEFVQQQWCTNPHFGGLTRDPDPLLGGSSSFASMGKPCFTVQTDMGRAPQPRAVDLPRFVTLRGSSYFFMPSIPALRLLADAVIEKGGLPTVATVEKVPDDEQIYIDSLIDRLRDKMREDYLPGMTKRDAHPKMHGCVVAELTVDPGLPPALSVGIFATPRKYNAYVRFSNQSGTIAPDSTRDIRGVAIKLFDVKGPKLLDGHEGSETQDMILISHDAFVTKDVQEFDALIKALFRGRLSFLGFLATHLRVARNLLRSLGSHESPLSVTYFGVTPYLLGASPVKYSLVPTTPQVAKAQKTASDDFLRDALTTHLEASAATFELRVQPQLPGEPIEDPGKAWRGPWQRVATLTIPRQTFASNEALGENLSMNPWRCLPEHRPLGGINRARRQVYRVLSRFRRERNLQSMSEPGPPVL